MPKERTQKVRVFVGHNEITSQVADVRIDVIPDGPQVATITVFTNPVGVDDEGNLRIWIDTD